jgi:hypothetical protein
VEGDYLFSFLEGLRKTRKENLGRVSRRVGRESMQRSAEPVNLPTWYWLL